MRKVCLKIHGLALMLAVLAGIAGEARGQAVLEPIQFTNTWRYDQSGRDLTGTLWRTNFGYVEDSLWQPLSRGLLGFEPDTPGNYTVHAPITTPLTISSTVITYYFRTTFQFSGSTAGMRLISSNLVDDGCVIYLNGMEAGRIRMGAAGANHNATTLAGNNPMEGTIEVVELNPSFLRQGVNLMAVEVHQSSVGSSDAMMGMKLVAIVPTTLVITNQPVGGTIAVGESLTLSVGVSGGPVFYQWLRNGAVIPGATSSTYNILNAQLGSAGTYQVRVTNAVSSLLSSPAVVNVVSDTTGPTLVSALLRDTRDTNQIVITFSEVLKSTINVTNSPVTNGANYRINLCGSSSTVLITNVAAQGSLVQLLVSGPNWDPEGCYYLTVNNIPDSRDNNINPNSIIGLSRLVSTANLIQMSDHWDFYSQWFSDPNKLTVYDEWYRTNFVVDANYTNQWATDADQVGIYWTDVNATAVLCGGDMLGSLVTIADEPGLFRRTFTLPDGFDRSAELRLRYMVDDGLVLYLNGLEIYRNNVAGTGPVTPSTRAVTSVPNPTCVTNVMVQVTNLFPTGPNWLAVAVPQVVDQQSDAYFGLEMDAVRTVTSATPTNPPVSPRIVRTRQGTNQILSWPATNYGYALMFTTNFLGPNGADSVWTQVKDQSNPYTNSMTGPAAGPRKFFRLVR